MNKKILSLVALLSIFVQLFCASNTQNETSLVSAIAEYRELVNTPKANAKRQRHLFKQIREAVFAKNPKTEGLSAIILTKGAPREVQQLLKRLSPFEIVSLEDNSCALHLLAKRAVVTADYKECHILSSLCMYLARPSARAALSKQNNGGDIPFSVARNICIERRAKSSKKNHYRAALLKLLVPDVSDANRKARKIAIKLGCDEPIVFDQGVSQYSLLSAEEKYQVAEQFVFVCPNVRRMAIYLWKQHPIDAIFDAFILAQKDESSALYWLNYITSSSYERNAEITAKVLTGWLLKCFSKEVIPLMVVDELLDSGANPGMQVTCGEEIIEPIMKLMQRMNDGVGIDRISKALVKATNVVSKQRSLDLLPHETIRQAMARDKYEEEQRKELLCRFSNALAQFGETQSIESFEAHWRLWKSICKHLGVPVKRFRCMTLSMLKDVQSDDDKKINSFFRNTLDPLQKFAMACEISAFAYYIACNASSKEIYSISEKVYDIETFLQMGKAIESSREKKDQNIEKARDIWASLNGPSRIQIRDLIARAYEQKVLAQNGSASAESPSPS